MLAKSFDSAGITSSSNLHTALHTMLTQDRLILDCVDDANEFEDYDNFDSSEEHIFDAVNNADMVDFNEINHNFANWHLFFGHDSPASENEPQIEQNRSPQSIRQSNGCVDIQQKKNG